jgi:protein transport protein SEC31
MQRVSARAPASFLPQVKDTEKRLNLLFDHLNNGELVRPDTVATLTQLAEALEARNYEAAQRLQVDIQRDKTDENGNWMVCYANRPLLAPPHVCLPTDRFFFNRSVSNDSSA